jgi:ubiquitin C-terminal hydrolase
MNFDKYKNNGLCGLANLGNTCYINSCIQILSHTYELGLFLENGNYKTKINNRYDSALMIEWDNLRKLLWNENNNNSVPNVLSPNRFLKVIQAVASTKGIEMFTGFAQNDVPEFLLFLIDCFHNSLCREINMTIQGTVENETDKIAFQCFDMMKKMYSKEYSEIVNLFYGIHVSELISLDTKERLNITPEPFFMIDLPIPIDLKTCSLIDCFNLYVEGEILKDENAWFNEKTNQKQNVKKKISFWSLPSILVLDLKRFNAKRMKLQNLITFPLDNLDLSSYVIGYKKKSYLYELYGVCNHSGSVLGGHYTSFIKNANNKWYLCNDTSVTEVPRVESIISPKAYVLFYRKKPQ